MFEIVFVFSGTTIPCEHFKTFLDSHCTQNKYAIFKLLILNNLELYIPFGSGQKAFLMKGKRICLLLFFASTSNTRRKCLTL